MSSAVDLSLERSAEEATLSLHGVVHESDAAAASGMCMALPPTVRMLRIDARDVTELQEFAAPMLRSLVRRWRRGRHGYVDLRIDRRLLRALADRPMANDANQPIVAAVELADPSAALTAAFL
jgi:hypothetical protein